MLPLIFGALAIGALIVALHWSDVVDWLDNLVSKLKRLWSEVRTSLPHAAMVVGDLIVKGADTLARIIHKTYYKQDNKWYEETHTSQVSESEVPDYIREKLSRGRETDITGEMEEELGLEI